ncbi:hypothetical protein BST81_24580 [Leptolyngbya sp. 'hensonii']|uniref:hypothetical protein n=1 Tax=Leptolyngbya sp. 'hensonii' TaxID=1922337 RepID=UPI00094F9686|nr:hypothetical protein [Leptolyngbya sp. 'hensonii']OLP15793.1 hypothetical protein BST81_24580 [Leptolyngbya sp. 'hensonii']
MVDKTCLEMARQGNPQAIATLISQRLQPRGITTKALLKDSCLQILLESKDIPDPQIVAFIQKGIASLNLRSVTRLRVYGRQIGQQRLSASHFCDEYKCLELCLKERAKL